MAKITVQNTKKFCDEIKKELSLVTWPTRKDLVISVSIVAISVLIAGLAFFAADYLLYNFIQFLIEL